MKYISLFSGIGGFEVAIQKRWVDAECLGYSEIKPSAIKVYEHHYPNHKNLGDITKITDEKILELVKDGCDLIVGGFPCTNLSSIAAISGNYDGLDGPESGLFYELLRIIKVAKPKYIIIENNNSMKKCNKKLITELFREIFPEIEMNMIDASDFGVQTRKRLYWTNFKIKDLPKECSQTWDDVLEPIDNVYNLRKNCKRINGYNTKINRKNIKQKTRIMKLIENDTYEFVYTSCEKNEISRWELCTISDNMHIQIYTPYPVGKSRPRLARDNLLIDRRTEPGFIFRKFSIKETERLFWFPDDYTSMVKQTHSEDLLGNTVVVKVIDYIIQNI
jgi:DNA-cytosine methyltransferase